MENVVKKVLEKHSFDKTKLIEIIKEIQAEKKFISQETMNEIGKGLKLSNVEVDGVTSFYHFLSKKPLGKYNIYLNTNIISEMNQRKEVLKAFEDAIGIKIGNLSQDGTFGFYSTSCIGMNDQEPSAIINGTIFTKLNPGHVKEIVAELKKGANVENLVKNYGDGKNQDQLIKSMVTNNIHKRGQVILGSFTQGESLKKLNTMTSDNVIEEVKNSQLKGRGGAGFPTGVKWETCKKAKGDKKYVFCNADEGEPGTFKDRVLLTEVPELMFEGMVVAGYAIGATEGVLYLRHEYTYLRKYLENVLSEMRKKNFLGKNIAGKNGFNFDISIKMGAGAYVCGEESALIESAEGKRGEPRDRPPYPVEVGYLGYPTSVNNVETFCCVTKIISNGANWFKGFGTAKSTGTKIMSISGDCEKPGIYEIDLGISLKEFLDMAGAKNIKAVQVGGPSGLCVGESAFNRKLAFEDLHAACGAMLVFNKSRNLFDVLNNFMEFFVEESCGYCIPCRAGNVLLRDKLEKIAHGHGTKKDLDELDSWAKIVKTMSRCGLGQASPNCLISSIENFRSDYESKLKPENTTGIHDFDMMKAVKDSCEYAGRKPNLKHH